MSKKFVTPKEIYEQLLNNFQIKSKAGRIDIELGGISEKYSGRDAIGSLLEAWVRKWLEYNNYNFETNKDTQKFPDFILPIQNSENSNFLEIKAFNASKNPAFDIANFDSYITNILENPKKLDTDYLILSYKMENSELKIDNLFLKKVWEISTTSKEYPIKLQLKKKAPYNIRPCNWISQKAKFKPFENRESFIKAISETNKKFSDRKNYKENWYSLVKEKYELETNKKL